ncbi:MAG TPA: aldo/keto reductase [Bacteroidales bacterium]|nr:aldo/keto reductase [Bacteroidales bacterium]
MKTINDFFILSNGVKIPVIGFGTWQIPDGKVAYDSVLFALKAGYRHIDTALAYGNEKSVGRAVRDSGIDRSEIFITSKLPAEIKSYDKALRKYDETISNLDLGYIDLYLIHAPWPWNEKGADYTKENKEVWRAMEEIYNGKNCRAVGVSNFNVKDMTAILDTCTVKPMVNQIKYYIGYTEDDITWFCRSNNILVEGYSPLATGRILANKEIDLLAKKYNRTLPQICIRYLIQHGVLPLPKSVTAERISENFAVDFEITKEDMKYLDNLKETV